MKAQEAMELTKGSIKTKGILFKIKLAWLCGRLNYKIERDAELGQGTTKLENISERTARLYFPLMAKLYEADDYLVCYDNRYYSINDFIVFWDKSKFPKEAMHRHDYCTEE